MDACHGKDQLEDRSSFEAAFLDEFRNVFEVLFCVEPPLVPGDLVEEESLKPERGLDQGWRNRNLALACSSSWGFVLSFGSREFFLRQRGLGFCLFILVERERRFTPAFLRR